MADIDALKGFNPNPSGGGGWLKLEDGDTVKIRIASLPVIFQNSFEQPNGEVNVDTRFGFIVYNHDEKKAQRWVTNGATYGTQIMPLLEDDDYGDWREYDVKLSRSGVKAQTRYSIRPGIKREPLTDGQKAECEAIDLVADISKSKGASSVMWLADYKDQQEQGVSHPDSPTPGYDKAKAEADKHKKPEPKDDVVIEDIGDDPVNLDDIPF